MPKTMHKAMLAVAGALAVSIASAQAAPKLDKETCEQLKGEQAKFMASGIVVDIQKGVDWGKANLTPERIREIEHFIQLDEQLKFGCRIVTMTADIFRASEAATQLESPPAPPPAPVTAPAAGQKSRMSDDGPVRSVTPKPKPKPAATAEQSAQPAAASKPKPKPKPKPADAYIPERTGPPIMAP